jgi:hypothetical protein
MIVLIPQNLVSRESPYAADKHSLKIMSRIVCDHLKECHDFRSEHGLKGKPTDPRTIYGSWINIKAEDWKAIASQYRSILERLEQDCWIERCGHYSNYEGNRFPMSYRLHESRHADRLTLWPVTQRLSKRKFYRVDHGVAGELHPEYLAGKGHLNAFAINDSDCLGLDSICDESEWPDLQRQYIARFSSMQWWSVVDDYGRFHSPLTSFPSRGRPFLRCEGEGLCGFDFCNMQPAILALQTVLPVPGGEAEAYAGLCREGRIYEHMLEVCPEFGDRAAVKEAFLTMLNMKNEMMARTAIYGAFSKAFPTFARAVCDIKKDDHKDMTRFLQYHETQLMFGGVVRSFRSSTDAPFFTVHDAVFTKSSESMRLQRALEITVKQNNIPTSVKRESTTQPSTPIYVGMNDCGGDYASGV